MNKLPLFVIFCAIGYFAWHELGLEQRLFSSEESTDSALAEAYRNSQSDLQVEGSGRIIQLLPDDNDGRPHQRFILRLNSGQTLLIAHNISLAPRIQELEIGDTVEFYGEYEWNSKGGVIHWTHDDPQNRHVAGWLKHNGRIYQ